MLSMICAASRIPCVAASRRFARCSRASVPLVLAAQISRTASRRNALPERSAASAWPTVIWTIAWSRSSPCIARGVLAPASSPNVSRHVRAIPNATAASPEANSSVRGILNKGAFSSSGAVCESTVRSVGTKTSFTAKWWVPVPRMPRVCQVSSSSASATGTKK